VTAAALSVVIPALNAVRALAGTIESVRRYADEIIVSDGGSCDGTQAVAAELGVHAIFGPRGRGPQIAAGVAAASGTWILILHADTRLAEGWWEAARAFMSGTPDQAAYFRFALDSDDPRARRLEHAVAWRCRRFALPYGDQGLLISRSFLARVGGIRPMVLMEDVDLVRRIGRARLVGLDAAAVTSGAKWERDGWYRRSARNISCLALYLAGVPPTVLVRLYG
jgi:rSAM/selenodomain-associated transferase 2